MITQANFLDAYHTFKSAPQCSENDHDAMMIGAFILDIHHLVSQCCDGQTSINHDQVLQNIDRRRMDLQEILDHPHSNFVDECSELISFLSGDNNTINSHISQASSFAERCLTQVLLQKRVDKLEHPSLYP